MATKMTGAETVATMIGKFVAELTAKIEHDSVSTMQEMVSTAFGSSSAVPALRKSVNATKHNYTRKPCPVPGCSHLAAPRHSMVCPDHRDLTQIQKDEYKAKAMAPGGLWYHERKPKAKVKPLTVVV